MDYRIDLAAAAVRWWGLEAELFRDFHRTLPPGTQLLDDAGRHDQLRRRHSGSRGGQGGWWRR